jgi:hypothetical protein
MKRPVLRIFFTILLALFGIFFTTVMRQFGFALSGNGMGARLFVFLVTGPENVCLLIWPLLFSFLLWTRHLRIAITVLCLSLIPLLWATILLGGEGFQDDAVKSIWKQARPVIYIFGTFFVFPSMLGLGISIPRVIKSIGQNRKAV